MIRIVAAAILAAVLAACGTATGAEPIDPATADLVVSAENLKFDQTAITVPAGEPFTILFRNVESAPHNIAIYRDASKAEKLFAGEVISDAEVRYEVPALAAGSYHFECELHPEMKGTITAQ